MCRATCCSAAYGCTRIGKVSELISTGEMRTWFKSTTLNPETPFTSSSPFVAAANDHDHHLFSWESIVGKGHRGRVSVDRGHAKSLGTAAGEGTGNRRVVYNERNPSPDSIIVGDRGQDMHP